MISRLPRKAGEPKLKHYSFLCVSGHCLLCDLNLQTRIHLTCIQGAKNLDQLSVNCCRIPTLTRYSPVRKRLFRLSPQIYPCESLPLHDLRRIPTFVARISQTAREAGVTFLVNEWNDGRDLQWGYAEQTLAFIYPVRGTGGHFGDDSQWAKDPAVVWRDRFFQQTHINHLEVITMARGLLLWLLGVPVGLIMLIWMFGFLH